MNQSRNNQPDEDENQQKTLNHEDCEG